MRAPLGNVEFGFSCEIGRPARMSGEHLHHEIEINYLFSGSMIYLAHGKLTAVPSRRFTLFWGAVPHQVLEFSEDARICWITIPFAWFLGWPLAKSFVSDLLSGRLLHENAEDSGTEVYHRWHADISSGDRELRQIALLELEARIRRLALQPKGCRKHSVLIPGGLSKVEQMARHVALHYTEPIYTRDITEATGLHGNYATTLFRKTCGMTLQSYLTRHRIFHAQRLLATTERKIIDVALESGFSSVNQFYEMFRRLCGESPRHYRVKFR